MVLGPICLIDALPSHHPSYDAGTDTAVSGSFENAAAPIWWSNCVPKCLCKLGHLELEMRLGFSFFLNPPYIGNKASEVYLTYSIAKEII